MLDSGTYTLIARNELGEAQSSVDLVVNGRETLFLDAQHPEGLERIAELEQPKDFGLPEIPDRECDQSPKFLGNLQDAEVHEFEDINFEIKLVPVNDPTYYYIQILYILYTKYINNKYIMSRLEANYDPISKI